MGLTVACAGAGMAAGAGVAKGLGLDAVPDRAGKAAIGLVTASEWSKADGPRAKAARSDTLGGETAAPRPAAMV
jgi:hypothetical protein